MVQVQDCTTDLNIVPTASSKKASGKLEDRKHSNLYNGMTLLTEGEFKRQCKMYGGMLRNWADWRDVHITTGKQVQS